MTKLYTASKKTLNLRKAKNLKNNCYTCRKMIKPGDKVLTKYSTNHGGGTSIRHQSCAKRVGLL